jgi:hypothetical protein
MNQLIKAIYDKLLLALAAAVLAASFAWAWQRRAEVAGLRALPVAPVLAAAAYEPAQGLRLPDRKTATWPKASVQSQGGGWLYEVFTPPVIYYNALARSFSVTAPSGSAEGGMPFGLELLDVQLEPYRLQLAGYFGEPGDYLVAFVSPGRPETLLARSGRRFDELGITLQNFEVKKVVVEHHDTWPVYDVAALAVVRDERTGEEVVLDNRRRKLTDTPFAVLRFTAAGAAPRTLHEGDSFVDGGATYRVERIQLDPPEVVIARHSPGLPQPEMRVLRPAGRDGSLAGKGAKPKSFPAPPQTGLATRRP